MGAKPKTEVQLEELQNRWLLNGDKKAYEEMFEILVSYSRSLILKMTQGKKFLDGEYVFDQAVNATIKFFEQYEKNPDFRIDYSFGGVLRYKVIECLYGPKIQKNDAVLSLNSLVQNTNEVNELEDLQEFLDMRPYWSSSYDVEDPVYKLYHTEEEAIKTVISVISDVYQAGVSDFDFIKIMIAFLHKFRRSRTFEEYLNHYIRGTPLYDIYEDSEVEIVNRLKEEV